MDNTERHKDRYISFDNDLIDFSKFHFKRQLKEEYEVLSLNEFTERWVKVAKNGEVWMISLSVCTHESEKKN